MEIKETVQKLLQEMVVPDLSKIRDENSKILAILDLTNKRLDDVNTHLADQSRRIDDVRTELGEHIDETNKRIDDVRTELTRLFVDVRTELTLKMDKMYSDLVARIDANNERIDRFFLTSATREEQRRSDARMDRLERDVEDLRQRIAA